MHQSSNATCTVATTILRTLVTRVIFSTTQNQPSPTSLESYAKGFEEYLQSPLQVSAQSQNVVRADIEFAGCLSYMISLPLSLPPSLPHPLPPSPSLPPPPSLPPSFSLSLSASERQPGLSNLRSF